MIVPRCLEGDIMFFRVKKVKGYKYLQLVENRWENGMPRQRVIASLGRIDELQEKGQIDRLVLSLAKYAKRVEVRAKA